MANNEQKQIAISTIPIPKLTALMSNFISNTITHLNKLSVKGDEKLAEFDKKLNDLEIMTTLLEAKLNSLPEKYTSAYPPLEKTNLDDVTPIISNSIPNSNVEAINGSGNGVQNPPANSSDQGINNQGEEDKKENENPEQAVGGEAVEEMSPEDALENFLQKNEDYRSLYKMLKIGITINQVHQKVTMNGLDMDIFNELVTFAKNVNPNIH